MAGYVIGYIVYWLVWIAVAIAAIRALYLIIRYYKAKRKRH